MIAALLALLLAADASRAQLDVPTTEPVGRPVEELSVEPILEMRRKLDDSKALRAALAERILRSKIAAAISTDAQEEQRRSDVRDWIESDLNSAAEIALGLSRDDDSGTREFENTVSRYVIQTYERNPNAEKGTYGVLKTAARRSRPLLGDDPNATEEENRERLRTLFDGNGTQTNNVAGAAKPEASGTNPAPNTALGAFAYDRLSAANLRGYSPELLAMQNALNASRPPGAPKLIETGTLDAQTLAYPAHGLRYDLSKLENRLRQNRLDALAALAGTPRSAQDNSDPELETRLLAKVSAARLPRSLSVRQTTHAKIKAAISAFESAAARARDPKAISKALLLELSGLRRDAARWIAIASIEDELFAAEQDERLLTPELLSLIDVVPAPISMRQAYLRQGQRFVSEFSRLRGELEKIRDALASDAWLTSVSRIDRDLSRVRAARRVLRRETFDYRQTPADIHGALLKQTRWRSWLDALIIRYAPQTTHARNVVGRRQQLSRSLRAFDGIAAGSGGVGDVSPRPAQSSVQVD